MQLDEAKLPAGAASSVDCVRPPTSLHEHAMGTEPSRGPSDDTITSSSRRSQSADPDHKLNRQALVTTSGLLSLPPEIRDYIYDYAFRGTSGTVIYFHPGDIGAAYGALKDSLHRNLAVHVVACYPLKPGLPGWLQANKQILAEALDRFHRKAIFFYTGTHGKPLPDQFVSPGRLWLSRAMYADPTARVNAGLDIREQHDETGHKFYIFEFEKGGEEFFRQTMSYLKNPSSALQSFTLRFHVPIGLRNMAIDTSNNDIRSRINFIDGLSESLPRVSFVLYIVVWDDVYLDHGRILAAVKEEIRRIALLLVDSNRVTCEEKEVCYTHRSSNCTLCQSEGLDDYPRIWHFEATSAAYRRSLALERV